MDHEGSPLGQLAKLRTGLAGLGFDSDLGVSISLQGGPVDEELLQAAAAGDYDAVRRVLLDAPYELDPRVAETIVEDLRGGRAGP